MSTTTISFALIFILLFKGSTSFSIGLKPFHEKIPRFMSSFSDDFIEKQKGVSAQKSNVSRGKMKSVEEHLKHQKDVFDDMADFFHSGDASAPEIEPVLDYIVEKALRQMMSGSSETKFNILDVGSGTGALFPHYLNAADKMGIQLNITGVDLSDKMTSYAQDNAEKLMSDRTRQQKHLIECVTGDFIEILMGHKASHKDITGFSTGVVNEITGKFRGKYDAVVINACFANFYDRDSLMNAAATALKPGGILAVSHPLGSTFVSDLNRNSPDTVPSVLPNAEEFDELVKPHALSVMDLMDGSFEIEGKKMPIYFSTAKKITHRMLRSIIRLRGPVDSGYGRGGKKLGFPTANLPSSLFKNALSEVPTGVYIGFAVIESNGQEKGRNKIHKTVVNVGYSPTFQGEENKEKIVEAHLIVENGEIEGDFYEEIMRLALYGFLRPEMKFSSFPELVKAITNDVATAKTSLDMDHFTMFKTKDPFLSEFSVPWVGSSGGSIDASYEFERVME
jgi:riboflavin kinase